jgi:MFS family permease
MTTSPPRYSKEKVSYEEYPTAIADNDFAFPVDYEERNRVLRKLDTRLLPFVSLLYLLSFLDRSNIGNAKVAGMAKDLHLVGLKYNIAAAMFFIPYCFAEVPSNILLKLVRPSRWIPSIMVAWGLVMTLMCLVNSYRGLVIARVFLGLTEAGLFPGVTYYLSLWYPREKLALRVAIFFSAATVAGAFGGTLAYGIEKMEGIGGLHGWQWIFCLEGIVTVLVALVSFFFMHDYPETATFLTEAERSHVIRMLKADAKATAQHFDRKFIWQAFTDYKTYIQIQIYMGLLIPVYGISLFLPTIIQQLGFSAARAQLLTVPPFVAGCACTIIVGFLSDRYKKRGLFIIGGCLVSLVGYIVLYTQSKPGPGYFGGVLAAMGVFPTIAVALAWSGGNAGGDVKRGVVLAMVIGIGNLGGICSSFIYFHPPRFHVGHGTLAGFLCLSILLSVFSMWNYNRLNKIKEDICEKEGIGEKDRAKYVDLGDQSPLFRYAL